MGVLIFLEKISRTNVWRFPKTGKSPARMFGVFRRQESLLHECLAFSKDRKISRTNVWRFPKTGKYLTWAYKALCQSLKALTKYK
ncbi:hypothetical protein [Bergeyella zoohelcum]|uniref:hypothetical protein n=1 Tax=Bergeyella zoohelcum TaxID=1015 RepID=UPI0037369A2A